MKKVSELVNELDILCKELEQETAQKNGKICLGDKLYLTDPCYAISVECQQLLENVNSGIWSVAYNCNEYEDNRKEVILSLNHEDYNNIFEDYEEKITSKELGVDSGTIGVFDREYYEEYHFDNGIDNNWYEKNICDFEHNIQEGLNLTENKGVWIYTSCGDGSFVANLYLKNDKVCGIEIIC